MSVFKDDLLLGYRLLVTGGGSGIGQGIALALSRHGAQVAVLGRQLDPLNATVMQMQPNQGLALAADVRQPEQLVSSLDTIAQKFGGLDGIINAAAGNFPCAAAKLSYNGFRTVVDIDLMGTFNVCRAAFELLRQSGNASIINISATLHYGGTPWQSHVSAAKAGIDALTRNLAVEWGPVGIRVNAIAPGPIDGTEGMRRLASPPQKAQMVHDIPLQRFGQIDDIANAVLFLSSPAAAFISGATLVVDGGRWLNNKLVDVAAF